MSIDSYMLWLWMVAIIRLYVREIKEAIFTSAFCSLKFQTLYFCNTVYFFSSVGTRTHSQFVFHTNNPRPFWGPSPNNPGPFWGPSPNTSPLTALAVSNFWPITDLLILTSHRLVYSDQLQNNTTTLKTV